MEGATGTGPRFDLNNSELHMSQQNAEELAEQISPQEQDHQPGTEAEMDPQRKLSEIATLEQGNLRTKSLL